MMARGYVRAGAGARATIAGDIGAQAPDAPELMCRSTGAASVPTVTPWAEIEHLYTKLASWW